MSVRHTGPDTLQIDGGGRGSVPFRISNQGRAPLARRLSARLPDGWRGLVPGADVSLAADSQVVRIVGFFVPEQAAAGIYAISADIAGTADSVFVRVREQPQLAVSPEESPKWVSAGTAYHVRFRIANTGNVAARVQPRLESAGGLEVRADTSARDLPPGASFTVDAEVATREDVPGIFTHRLLLRAASADASAEAASRVDVMPLGRARDEGTRGGIPAEFRVRLSEDPRAGAPVRLQARGPLRPGSATEFDLLLQGPADGYSVFGEPDVYRIAIASPDYAIRLGDHVYSLSQLTEPAREGLGAEARLRGGPLEIGGYVQRDRRGFYADSQAASYARLRLGSPLSVRVNWLHDTGRGHPRQVFSGETSLRVGDWLGLDAEYGLRPAADADAYSVSLRALTRPVSINLRHVRGDTAFAGVYGGVRLDAAHLTVQPWTGLFLDATLEEQILQSRFFGLAQSQSVRAERVALRYGSWVSVEGRHTLRSSTLIGAAFNRELQAARVRLGIPLRRVVFYPSAEMGRVINADSIEPTFWTAGLQAHAAFTTGSLAAAFEYASGASFDGTRDENVYSGSFSGSLDLRPFGRLHFGAYGSRQVGADVNRSSLVGNGSIEHVFGNGHSLALRVRSRVLSGLFEQQETITLLDYTVPFAIPTSAGAMGRGTISGQVYDLTTGEPITRAVVILGDRRLVTDARGHVEFTNLEPGTYSLRVDRASAGLDRVPTLALPLTLTVMPTTRTTFALPFATAANLTARVSIARPTTIRAFADTLAVGDLEPMPGVLLQFSREAERFVRTTDETGRVSLSDLRPGRWTVRPINAVLPPFHQFEADSIIVDLPPGQRDTASLTVRPVQRRLQIIATGELTEQRDSARTEPHRSVMEPVRTVIPRERRTATPTGPARATRADRRPAAVDILPQGWSTFVVSGSATTVMEVARRLYYETYLWPRIWLANLSQVPDPDNLPQGLVLKIPPKAPLTPLEMKYANDYYSRWR
ncbi:MAG: carboxypeptidase regulatory-like domain-containing protein [Gemmatimonadota bacterium]